MKLFRLVTTDNGKDVTNPPSYFPDKGSAKEARAILNLGKKGTQFETEASYWVDGKQIKPYPYSIKRGPDHYRGASK
jgi:hypothetical protein